MHTPDTHRRTYAIHCKNPDDPYGDQIISYILQEFPHISTARSDSLLNLLTNAILATGNVRFGPIPEPESVVAIREVVADYIGNTQPIPFLVGWGSEKPNGSGVDIAELFALRQLIGLRERIQSYYVPGVIVNIRVEDVSAPHLFFDRPDEARRDAVLYTHGFVGLVQALDLDKWLHVIPESTLTSEATFNQRANEILPVMEAHLANPHKPDIANLLAVMGWTNPVTNETYEYYMARYRHLYPNKTDEQKRHIMARYFTASLARKQLHLTGVGSTWRDYLELAFHTPAPGFPSARKRIYYRTIPSSITHNHMAPWRSKGYLKIGDRVKAALTTFDNKDQQFNENVLTLDNGIVSQDIQADYIVEQ